MVTKREGATLRRRGTTLVAYLAVWTTLDVLAAEFEVARGVSLWYPPAAVSVLLLVLCGVRWAPALLVTGIVHSAVVNPVGLEWWQVLVIATVTTASFAAGAWAFLHRLGGDRRLRRLGDVLRFGLTMCVLAPLPMAVVQVALLDLAGSIDTEAFLSGAAAFWAGSATGIGMLTPVALVLTRRWEPGRGVIDVAPIDGDAHDDASSHDRADDDARDADDARDERPATAGRAAASDGYDLHGEVPSPVGRGETVAQVITLGVAVWFAFGSESGSLDYSYLVYGPIIWIALRGGFLRASLAVLATNVGAVALNGGDIPEGDGVALQFGLVSLTLLGVTLGASVDQRRADGERSRAASLRDPLTGLANRTVLTERLEDVLGRRAGSAAPAAGGVLLFLDLDRFKPINDALGHRAGDAVLVAVAERLEGAVRPGDTVARLGGDEFAVLLDGMQPDQLDEAAERVLEAVADPIETPTGSVRVTASVGSVLIDRTGVATDDDPGTDEILHRADIALHRAKLRGLNRHVAFDVEMHAEAVLAQRRESALRRSLARHEIDVVYQPIVDVASGGLVGAEALARWTLPDGTKVAPCDLVAAAEVSSQIDRLGLEVLRTACRAAVDWPSHLKVAVNVSAVELQRPGYAASVRSVLDETGLDPSRLELELTETKLIGEAAEAGAQLTASGIRLVLDDFGTGFSSISSLHDLPIQAIKIDRSYVSTLTTDSRSVDLVKAILCIGEQLGLEVTAEGVELDEHWDFLARHGCHRAQGFLLGRPRRELPAADRWVSASQPGDVR